MKKSIKNTIMIGMAAVLIGTSAVTISYAKENRGAQFNPPSLVQQSDGNQLQNPFENFSQNGDGQKGNGFNNRQLPDNQQDDGNENNSNQPPQPPSNQQDGSDSQQTPDNSESGDSSADTKDSATNTSLSIDSLAQDDAQNSARQGFPANNFRSRNRSVISALCYMFAALQIAIILSILAYLIISRMNKISFNEVLANMRKTKKEQDNE